MRQHAYQDTKRIVKRWADHSIDFEHVFFNEYVTRKLSNAAEEYHAVCHALDDCGTKAYCYYVTVEFNGKRLFAPPSNAIFVTGSLLVVVSIKEENALTPSYLTSVRVEPWAAWRHDVHVDYATKLALKARLRSEGKQLDLI